MNTQYKTNEPIKNMGIYFKPLFMLPFSTMDTIREEKNEIMAIAAIEKYLKLFGSTFTGETLKGKLAVAVPANLSTKFNIMFRR